MTTIGYATLQIIPSLQGVTEAIEKQVDGKVVDVKIAPKVDQPAAERAGKQARETVEKHTKEVTVEPKVDQRKAEEAGKKTGEAVAKGTTGASTAIGQAMVGILEGAGGEAGRRLGERLAQAIPTGMTGSAQRIGDSLRRQLPEVGEAAGRQIGGGIAEGIANTIGKDRLDRAGKAVITGLTRAVGAANNAATIGVAIGNQVAGGLSSASGAISGAASTITDTIGGITQGIDTTRQLLGGDDSWAAPGLDVLNSALAKATPLLETMNGAALIASSGAQAISVATGIASKAQLLWNAALIANPIGLIVTAIAALVAGLVLFFTKTELGRKIWQGFTEYLKVAWEVVKAAFSTAWGAISAIWDAMVEGASAVWEGIKSKFTAVVDFVKGLPSAIAGAARGMWDGIANAFKSMIDKMKGWWNSFADALSFTTPDWLPGDPVTFSLPKLSTGGYTGSGPADRVAGVVHGGEYVIKASSTAGIENAFPGLLDYLNNKGALPGFAGGGKVALGNISGPGITTAEQQSMWDAVRAKFPDAILTSATRTVMTEGHPDFHNAGRAIDISGPGMGAIASWIASTYPDSLELIHSPFSHNIKNGKNVGDGVAFYGAGLMSAHGDHVHWALGKTAKPSAATTTDTTASMPELDSGASSSTSSAQPSYSGAESQQSQQSNSIKLSAPSSLSGIGSWAGQFGGDLVGNTVQSEDPRTKTLLGGLGDLGSAAGSLIDGQVGSALSVFGVGDSPGWLKGISTLVSGMSIKQSGGGENSVAPASSLISSAPKAASAAIGSVHTGGGQAPGPGVTYNIRTATVEDSFLQARRLENERAAAKLARY